MPTPQINPVPFSEEEEFEFEMELEKERGGSTGIAPVPTIPQMLAKHQSNIAAGQKIDDSRILGFPKADLARTAAAISRTAGGILSNTPLVGAIPATIGETAAQAVETQSGIREKPNLMQIGAAGALGAIPGGFVARGVKPSTKIGAQIAGTAEGAMVGSASTTLPALAEGRLPDSGEAAIGLMTGAALGGAIPQRLAMPRPDYTDKAHKQIYAAIQPSASDTREFSEHLNAALPYIYANRKGHVNTIADMEQAARGTMRRLWNLHIEPVIAMNSHAQVDTSGIAQSLRNRINRDTPKSVRKAIETEATKFDQPRTLGELSRVLKETNAKTKGLQEASGKSARTLRTDPKTGWRFDLLNELRSSLADEAGRITGNGEMYMKLRKDWGALSEVADEAGEAAKRWEHQKKIEGSSLPIVQRVVKSSVGALGFGGVAAVRRGTAEAAKEYMQSPDRLVKSAFKNMRFGQRMSEQFPEPLPLPQRRALPAMGETGEPSLGDLQYRVPEDRAAAKHARQRREGSRLLTGQTRSDLANQPAPGEPPPMQPSEMELSPGQNVRPPFGATAPVGQPRPSPITLGTPPDTRIQGMPPSKPRIRVKAGGPSSSQISPVPEVSMSVQPERRLTENFELRKAVSAARSAQANPEIAQQASILKIALDDPATSSQAIDQLDALNQQYPWVIDYLTLVYDKVNKVGVRGQP